MTGCDIEPPQDRRIHVEACADMGLLREVPGAASDLREQIIRNAARQIAGALENFTAARDDERRHVRVISIDALVIHPDDWREAMRTAYMAGIRDAAEAAHRRAVPKV